jgi:hypothetical protein
MKHSIANKLDQIRKSVESIVSPTKVRRSCLPDEGESAECDAEMRIALQELRELVLAMPLRARSSVDTAITGFLVELSEISTNATEIGPLLIDIPGNDGYAVQSLQIDLSGS